MPKSDICPLSSAASMSVTTLRTAVSVEKTVKLYTSLNFDLLDVNCGTSQLASALLILEDWSKRSQLRINTSKCSILHLGPHNPSLSYTLNHNPLPVANSVRDLGITFNCKLKFNEYINKIVSKAFQLVNLIFRSFVSRCPKILCRAFKTYIRPILEYCTPVWSPYLLYVLFTHSSNYSTLCHSLPLFQNHRH